MSADNWARCPRCTRIGTAQLKAREEEVQESYGKVPVDEFDEARRKLAIDRKVFENRERTFREDYEFYGAEEGIVTTDYSGLCSKCGLKLKFRESRPIPGLDEL